MNTNWSTPKTNIFAGINNLRLALAAGNNARLIRARNEDCAFPIRVRKHDTDFRNYEFQCGYMRTRSEILRDPAMTDFEKHLALNYKTCYGSREAMETYYTSGKLSPDNFKGMGVGHLVRVEDMIRFYVVIGNPELAEMFKAQYLGDEQCNDKHFWDFYRYKHGSQFAPKRFRRKLWVVELLDRDEPRAELPAMHRISVAVLRALVYPLKYVPKRSVLRMPEYTNYTFRIGGVINGFAVEFQVPKRFGFN
jgi:hypothetical protein